MSAEKWQRRIKSWKYYQTSELTSGKWALRRHFKRLRRHKSMVTKSATTLARFAKSLMDNMVSMGREEAEVINLMWQESY